MSSHPHPLPGQPVLPPLVRACQSAFTGRASRHGKGYFEEGRVDIEGANADTVFAAVTGSRPEPYPVVVRFAEVRTRGRLLVECSCSYFFEGFPCKHIYATLLAIEAAGMEMVSPGFLESRLDVVPQKLGLKRDSDWFFAGKDSLARAIGGEAPAAPAKSKTYKDRLEALRRAAAPWHQRAPLEAALERTRPRELLYRLHVNRSDTVQALVVECLERDPESPEVPLAIAGPLASKDPSLATNPADRAVFELLLAMPPATPVFAESPEDGGDRGVVVPPPFWPATLRALAATGRFEGLGPDGSETFGPLVFEDATPWRPEVRIEVRGEELVLTAGLARPDDAGVEERRPLGDAVLLLRDGLVVFREGVARFFADNGFNWVRHLRKHGEIAFPPESLTEVLRELAAMPGLPELHLPEPWTTRPGAMRPRAFFPEPEARARWLLADLGFDYGAARFPAGAPESGFVDAEAPALVRRDARAEEAALDLIGRLGATRSPGLDAHAVEVKRSDFDGVVRKLVSAGWEVEAHGRILRRLEAHELRLSSGTDWFELEGGFEFGGQRVGLPELLRAVRQNGGFVKLDDGTEGVVPEDWLERYGSLGELGVKKGDKLRFTKGQALFLDVLLAGQSEVHLDARFIAFRDRLRKVTSPQARTEPKTFSGALRSYQREGLGWLRYLQRLGLGGCLADDMGLGKTVQVLAVLEARRRLRRRLGGRIPPSLVVAPRSLIYNWLNEAQAFTPELRAASYTGAQRAEVLERLGELDVLITTYGTLRRDIAQLRELRFDYVILDEAQAIKNAGAQASKACRLLQGDHRLALSGTPVENHLLELWSIFEYLNPRTLGSKREFAALTRAGNEGGLSMIARGLRPLILRRTKDQVLTELPDKTELTIHCELEGDDLRLYNELRDHFRASINQKIHSVGIEKSRLHVLEALLRLRQAACHPGLIDPSRAGESSAKLDALLDHVREVIEEGHKVLVFSQFVQLLSIVRGHLDKEGVRYAYLDGRTLDREAQVRAFQEDPACSLFLISLKAGGFGLNLTAADYVFILDPWWNPAVEAQAIDRAHRIGQTRPVFAYRIISKNTVEEKILELHAKKRKLASAIISEDNAQLGQLTAEDLELLLA